MDSRAATPRYDEEDYDLRRPGPGRPDHHHGLRIMKLLLDPDVNAGNIFVEFPPRANRTVVLDRHTVLTLHDDDLTIVEILNLDAWGTPFDEAAAERVLEWVRTQLAQRDAS